MIKTYKVYDQMWDKNINMDRYIDINLNKDINDRI